MTKRIGAGEEHEYDMKYSERFNRLAKLQIRNSDLSMQASQMAKGNEKYTKRSLRQVSHHVREIVKNKNKLVASLEFAMNGK